MKVCNNCGYQSFDDNATICDNCGSKLVEGLKSRSVYKPKETQRSDDYYEGYRRAQSEYYHKRKRDTGGCGWMLLGFIIPPIISLILYFVLKGDYPNRANDIKKGAIVSIIICAIIILLTTCGYLNLLDKYSRYY